MGTPTGRKQGTALYRYHCNSARGLSVPVCSDIPAVASVEPKNKSSEIRKGNIPEVR